MWCSVYVWVNPRIRKYAIHKQWYQISWFGSKFHYLTIKMLNNRGMGIYKFGNNTYPWHIRRRPNLSHIYRGKKCVLWAGKYGNYKLPYNKTAYIIPFWTHTVIHECMLTQFTVEPTNALCSVTVTPTSCKSLCTHAVLSSQTSVNRYVTWKTPASTLPTQQWNKQ